MLDTINVLDLANVTGGQAATQQGIRPPFIGGVEGSDVDLDLRQPDPRDPPVQGIRPPFIGGVPGSDVDPCLRGGCCNKRR